MRVHKAAGGALVRAQRTEQTISPTLHGRTRTLVPSRACVFASAKLLQRQEWLGNVCNTRKYTGCVCIRARVSYTNEEYVRLQTALVQRIFRRGVVVGPGRILRVARSLNPPDPSAPFARTPSRPPAYPYARPPSCRLGSKAKASPLLHLRRNDPTTRMRPSLFPFILVPSQARGKTLFQTRTRDEPGGGVSLPGEIPRNKMFLIRRRRCSQREQQFFFIHTTETK